MNLQPASAVPPIFSLAEAEIEEMAGEIKPLAKELKGLKKRIARMAIFCDRGEEGGKMRRRSDVEIESSPEEEILYQHRRMYETTNNAATKLLERMESVTPSPDDVRQYANMIRTLHQMEAESKEHLQDMRKILLDLRAREKDVETKIINITQERSRLMSQLLQHKDKMDLAREGADQSTPELIEMMAKKHNVTVDEIRALMHAKPVDAEAG